MQQIPTIPNTIARTALFSFERGYLKHFILSILQASIICIFIKSDILSRDSLFGNFQTSLLLTLLIIPSILHFLMQKGSTLYKLIIVLSGLILFITITSYISLKSGNDIDYAVNMPIFVIFLIPYLFIYVQEQKLSYENFSSACRELRAAFLHVLKLCIIVSLVISLFLGLFNVVGLNLYFIFQDKYFATYYSSLLFGYFVYGFIKNKETILLPSDRLNVICNFLFKVICYISILFFLVYIIHLVRICLDVFGIAKYGTLLGKLKLLKYFLSISAIYITLFHLKFGNGQKSFSEILSNRKLVAGSFLIFAVIGLIEIAFISDSIFFKELASPITIYLIVFTLLCSVYFFAASSSIFKDKNSILKKSTIALSLIVILITGLFQIKEFSPTIIADKIKKLHGGDQSYGLIDYLVTGKVRKKNNVKPKINKNQKSTHTHYKPTNPQKYSKPILASQNKLKPKQYHWKDHINHHEYIKLSAEQSTVRKAKNFMNKKFPKGKIEFFVLEENIDFNNEDKEALVFYKLNNSLMLEIFEIKKHRLVKISEKTINSKDPKLKDKPQLLIYKIIAKEFKIINPAPKLKSIEIGDEDFFLNN